MVEQEEEGVSGLLVLPQNCVVVKVPYVVVVDCIPYAGYCVLGGVVVVEVLLVGCRVVVVGGLCVGGRAVLVVSLQQWV